MTDHEQERFEASLRQLKPGKLPDDLVARVQSAVSSKPNLASSTARQGPSFPSFVQILRWLVPATAVLLVSVLFWYRQQVSIEQNPSGLALKDSPREGPALLKADNVEIGKELVSSFDAVATLPGGEPVRFRCQQWINRVVVDDEKQGLLVESRMPWVVVVPVGFETY